MSMDKTKIKRAMALSFVAIGTAFAGLSILAKVKKTSSVYEDVQTVDKVQQLLGFSTFRTVFLI